MKTCMSLVWLLAIPSFAFAQNSLVGRAPTTSASAQPTTGQQTVTAEALSLAEKYAAEREAQARADERQRFDAKRKRWAQMCRAVEAQLESADQRLDVIDRHMELVRSTDPRIAALEADLENRIDRAEKQARDWAEVERTVTSIPQTLIDVFTGRGIRIGVSPDGVTVQKPDATSTPTTTATTSAAPTSTTTTTAGDPISGEVKGVAATTATGLALALAGWWWKRRSANNAATFDQRNANVTAAATQAALAQFFGMLRGGQPVRPHAAVQIGGDVPKPKPKPAVVAPAAAVPTAAFVDQLEALNSDEFNLALLGALNQRVNRNGSE